MPNPNRSNVVAEKSNHHRQLKEKTDQDDGRPPSNNLWIGNLTTDTSDADLFDLFGRYGEVDSVTNYASRNYAFIYFKRLEDARAATEGLQNALLRGNSIRIEFARPAKPGKNLWVGGIGPSVSKEQLEDEFLKFGKIVDLKFLRDRNSALIEYLKLEDAMVAVKDMNGRRLGGDQIRVDFLRSQPSRRENWSDFNDSRDGHFNNRSIGPPEPHWGPPDAGRSFFEVSQFGHKRHSPSHNSGGRREGQPSKVIWVGYPPTIQIDEQMLHNAMILFGEIERIKSFPSRHYSFVEFRSVDEARRAKEGLQGRLFNDPRIQIMFSSSELAPPKDSPGFFSGVKGPRPDLFFNDPPFGPGTMEFFGHNRPMTPNNFPGALAPNGMHGPNMSVRPFGPQAGFDQISAGSEMFNELAGLPHNFQEANSNSPVRQHWRRASSSPGIVPSAPSARPLPSIRPMPDTWDGSDPKDFQRESKRSRIDSHSRSDDASFPSRMIDDQGIGRDQLFGFEPQLDRGASAPLAQGQSHHNPLGVRPPSGGPPGQVHPDSDLCWRGVIAKGGTPVCQARCVPIGKGLDSQLPEIVNCSARTGLDMLAKHYQEASGFDIVFFLPDSEEDFASYTDFLHYLGAKDRAGVAKFEDGTTLFLVPPSDFLTKVLNVTGPERLYGIVLHLPQQKPSASVVHQKQKSIPPAQFIDRHQLPPLQTDYNALPPKSDQVVETAYSRVSHENARSHLHQFPFPPSGEPSSSLSVSRDYPSNPVTVPHSGVSLTPELIATLASFLPSGMQSSSSSNAELPSSSSNSGTKLFHSSVTADKPLSSQGWKPGHPVNHPSTPNQSREEQTLAAAQQFGYQFNTQGTPLKTQSPSYLNVTNGPDNSGQSIQDPGQVVGQQGFSSSRPANNFAAPSHGGRNTVSQQANQQFHLDAPLNPQKSYGTGNDNANIVLPDQVQQLHSALSGVGQGTAEGDADKNQRYQSTLQFAASLLLQIQQQQQQQQGNTQAANGSRGHQ
ncbi:Flowering time control protein fpa [Thalictrum thalictroides]|uniref:Flowering time control protein fpa n=1 Tax=Thalictrum thalictroides TaxID=46969 RepID=A0A7J6V6Q1_THATH|nr:Flowering time control protein fpa [Thalictrum thalictroides]